MLLSGNRKYSMEELKERLESSERTVYRYLNNLENAGLVLDRENGLYRLVQNTPELRSLHRLFHFSEEEAEIFYHSLSSLGIENETKARLLNKLHALYDFKALKRVKETPNVEKIKNLAEAINHKKSVILLNYRSSHSSTVNDRLVEPFQFMEDYKAVWCFDHADQKNKQFKISRIGDVEISDIIWRYEHEHKLPFHDAFRMSAPEPISQVKATLSLKAYNLIREEYPISEQYLKKKNGRYLLEIPIADFHGIGRFVLGLPDEIEVHEPEEFKSFLKEKRKKFDD